ncbi:MAG: hypothetical protein Athens101410_570 [Parcubacteria group bacterium Athens1014_10]|nr:MAG: hypothetical protein Athens101410_570 [Parcubacteria group bacterium Athens1014_10]TSD04714.1 MAG: hypothetical protein Athens071412_658 [Parcubacteria group bacterium Athens0714_12]
MLDLLKYTYLFDIKKIRESIEKLWQRYQKILNDENSTAEDLYEARVILYILGYFYPEKFALEAIERRIQYIEPKITLENFLKIVDSEKDCNKYNEIFNKLRDFYLIIKDIKNRKQNGSYLDEERFNKIFTKKTGIINRHPLDN